MLVSDLLANKGSSVETIQASATVADAIAAMRQHGIGALVVSSDGAHIEGIVSERDVVRRLDDLGGALVKEPVSSIMSSVIETCTSSDDTETLMATMTNHRIRHIPVLEDGVLVGIVSIGDVVKSRIDELQKDRDELVEYIHGR